MKRLTTLLLPFAGAAVLAATLTCAARAQDAEPTPTPDPHTYSDPAMNFTAPPEAVLLGRRELDPRSLGDDLQIVARWALHAGKEDVRYIDIAMEAFEGPPNQWEGQFESQAHNASDGVLIKGKTPMALLNGMPATFVEVASGSGFGARKEYAIVWADGVRGVVLSISSRIGDITSDQAKQLLHDASATLYPINQP